MEPVEEKIEAIQHVLASIFAAQRTLKVLAPEFKWAGLGNLLGDFGELVAIQAYKLKKASAGANGFDAVCEDGRKVQIKTNYAASQVGFRGNADILLVLNVTNDGNWTEMYFGPFAPVLAASRRSERDNKNMIAITKLQELQKVHGFKLQPKSLPELEVTPLPV
ncbi:hypothetical protein SRABI118_00120 [Massilia sp. Bi118]|uniref:DUF6998 domain-containing protein n=1 Tax=Massilia sp. Bi118 TaxID=2822346 RepID=UPI001D261B30|nr:hypothetical protein [Massilia sp. Bi118]CAH0134479.1 hypothetical protein SRABI118_00120 [Massilia sp. Bi118]